MVERKSSTILFEKKPTGGFNTNLFNKNYKQIDLADQYLLYKDMSQMMERYSPIDICYMIDVTSNMDSVKNVLKDNFKYLKEEVTKVFKNMEPRLAVIAFKDFEDKRNQIKKMDFTSKFEDIYSFLDKIECSGGGDDCEDLELPFRHALKLSWRSNCLFIYLVLDAPPHGSSYHDHFVSDDYLEMSKTKTIERICCHLRKYNIRLVIFRCNPRVDRTIEIIKKYYESCINRLYVIDLFLYNKLTSTSTLKSEKFIREEINQSFYISLSENFSMIYPPIEVSTNSEWEVTFSLPVNITFSVFTRDFVKAPLFNKNLFHPRSINTRINFNLEGELFVDIISTGPYSGCYNLSATIEGIENKFIITVPEFPAKKIEDIEARLDTNSYAQYFSLGYAPFSGAKPIRILPCFILEITSDISNLPLFNGSKFVVAQRYIDGEYVNYIKYKR